MLTKKLCPLLIHTNIKLFILFIYFLLLECVIFSVPSVLLLIAVVLCPNNAPVISKMSENVKASGLTQTVEQPLPPYCSHLTSASDRHQHQFGSDPKFLSQIPFFFFFVILALVYCWDRASQRCLIANGSRTNRSLRVLWILQKFHFNWLTFISDCIKSILQTITHHSHTLSSAWKVRNVNAVVSGNCGKLWKDYWVLTKLQVSVNKIQLKNVFTKITWEWVYLGYFLTLPWHLPTCCLKSQFTKHSCL